MTEQGREELDNFTLENTVCNTIAYRDKSTQVIKTLLRQTSQED